MPGIFPGWPGETTSKPETRNYFAQSEIFQDKINAQWVAKDPSFLHADSKDSDQTGRTLVLMVLSCHGSNIFEKNGHPVKVFLSFTSSHLISSQSLNLGGRWGTTDDAATIPFHPSLSSAALRESPNPIPVHSLMLSSHLFFCLPLLLAPFTVPCRIVFVMPEALGMWPYHPSFRFFTMVRRSSCTPIAFWILLRTSSFVTWSL